MTIWEVKMIVKEIKKIAKKHGIKVSKMRKAELIKAIQKKEGNIPCFGTDRFERCDEMNCLWRKDCQKAYKK